MEIVNVSATLATLCLVTAPARAQSLTQYWNGTTTTAGTSVQGGDGSWTNTNRNWTDATGASPQTWQSGTAIFAGPTPPEDPSTQAPTPYVVTVNDTITFQALQFQQPYNISLGAGSFTASGNAAVTTAANVVATISAPILGTSGLTKTGDGQLILLGAQPYLGGTLVSAGTLQLGDNVTSGSVVGNIINNAVLAFLPTLNTTQTVSNLISGTGIVQVQGSGVSAPATVMFTNANTYSGGTTLLGKGVASVANDGNLGASGGAISFYDGTLQVADGFSSARTLKMGENGAVQVDAGTAMLSGAIVNAMPGQSGSLEKTGAGTLVVSGPNTSQGFTVTGGTLRLGGAGVLGTSSAVVMNGGTFDLAGNPVAIGNFTGSAGLLTNSNATTPATLTTDASNNAGVGLTYHGNIQDGAGKVGFGLTGGRLFLSGTDTYSGATTVGSNAVLVASSATALSPNSAYVLTNGGGLDVHGFSSTIGSLAGGGGVSNESPGVAATLSVGNDNTSTTFSGFIQDGTSGQTTALTKVGTGTLALSGTNSYTGPTAINAGTLEVDGSITSAATINAGGALSGTGTTAGVMLANGGTLAPGNTANPFGTLAVGGAVSIANGSFYKVAIAPTANSSVAVTGPATILGGTVAVTPSAGAYRPNTHYTILTASGGVTGAFSALTTPMSSAFLTTSLSYDANDVYLNIVPTNATASGTPNYRTAATNPNQLAVANGLTNAGMLNGGIAPLLLALDQLTAPQAQAVFNALSGEGIAASQNAANGSAQMFGDAIFDQAVFYGGGGSNQIVLSEPNLGTRGPGAGFQALAPRSGSTVAPGDTLSAAALGLPVRELADLPRPYIVPAAVAPTRTWRAWGSGFGGQEDVRSNAIVGFAAQSNQIYGGAVGVDYQVSPNNLVGVAVGGSDGEFSVPNRSTSGSTTGGHIALYDVARFGAF